MKQLLVTLSVTLFLLSGCGDSAPSGVPSNSDSVAADTLPEMRSPATSELTIYMRNMESHFQRLGSELDSVGNLDSTLAVDFEGMFVMKPSPHIVMDSAFMAYGNDFLDKYDKLMSNTVVDSTHVLFNSAVDACIKCHHSFCPGPVVRIKKLRM